MVDLGPNIKSMTQSGAIAAAALDGAWLGIGHGRSCPRRGEDRSPRQHS